MVVSNESILHTGGEPGLHRKLCSHFNKFRIIVILVLLVIFSIFSTYDSIENIPEFSEFFYSDNISEFSKLFGPDDERQNDDDRILTFEESGRLGNLMMETATLILVGEKTNRSVQLLPQVAVKLSTLIDPLPLPYIDHSKHCVCTKCVECLCPTCNTWKKVLSWDFLRSPKSFSNFNHTLLYFYDSNLVMANIEQMKVLFRSLLRQQFVDTAQSFMHSLARNLNKTTSQITWVSVHVRRTDYINWIKYQFSGQQVDEKYFLFCMEKFRNRNSSNSSIIFLVTSDDIPWCRHYLTAPDVVFPELGGVEEDFVLLTQTNHSIYEYGSFGFWGAVLAGGETFVADGYSKQTHPILAAIQKNPPKGWTRVNISEMNVTKVTNVTKV